MAEVYDTGVFPACHKKQMKGREQDEGLFSPANKKNVEINTICYTQEGLTDEIMWVISP